MGGDGNEQLATRVASVWGVAGAGVDKAEAIKVEATKTASTKNMMRTFCWRRDARRMLGFVARIPGFILSKEYNIFSRWVAGHHSGRVDPRVRKISQGHEHTLSKGHRMTSENDRRNCTNNQPPQKVWAFGGTYTLSRATRLENKIVFLRTDPMLP